MKNRLRLRCSLLCALLLAGLVPFVGAQPGEEPEPPTSDPVAEEAPPALPPPPQTLIRPALPPIDRGVPTEEEAVVTTSGEELPPAPGEPEVEIFLDFADEEPVAEPSTPMVEDDAGVARESIYFVDTRTLTPDRDAAPATAPLEEPMVRGDLASTSITARGGAAQSDAPVDATTREEVQTEEVTVVVPATEEAPGEQPIDVAVSEEEGVAAAEITLTFPAEEPAVEDTGVLVTSDEDVDVEAEVTGEEEVTLAIDAADSTDGDPDTGADPAGEEGMTAVAESAAETGTPAAREDSGEITFTPIDEPVAVEVTPAEEEPARAETVRVSRRERQPLPPLETLLAQGLNGDGEAEAEVETEPAPAAEDAERTATPEEGAPAMDADEMTADVADERAEESGMPAPAETTATMTPPARERPAPRSEPEPEPLPEPEEATPPAAADVPADIVVEDPPPPPDPAMERVARQNAEQADEATEEDEVTLAFPASEPEPEPEATATPAPRRPRIPPPPPAEETAEAPARTMPQLSPAREESEGPPTYFLDPGADDDVELAGNDIILEFPGQQESSAAMEQDEDTISIDFPDEEIRVIVRNVADLYDLNVVIPDGLVGSTSIKLKDVTWQQVFSVILEDVGYTWIEDGNIIKIRSLEELALEPVDTRVFLINFAAAEELRGSISPLIDTANGGSIQVDVRSNALIITERPSRLNRIQEIIERLDRPTDQVMIESKFIEVSNADIKNIGVNWSSLSGWGLQAGPFNRTYERDDTSTESGNVRNSNSSNVTIESNRGTAGNSQNTGVTNIIEEVRNFQSIFSDTESRSDTAVFSADAFQVILSALKTNTDVELVSNPTVVTLNNTPARINIGEEFPIPQYNYNRERGEFEVSGFEYKPIGIILDVTPQVNSAGFVNLNIQPEISNRQGEVTFGGAGGAIIPIISTRKTLSTVTIKSGFTLAIGGLLESSFTDEETRVPVLGDIPLVGRVFRSDAVNHTSRNLIIFITAKILNPDGSTYEEVFSQETLAGMGIVESDLPGYEPTPEEEALYRELREARNALDQSQKRTELQNQLDALNALRYGPPPGAEDEEDKDGPVSRAR